MSTIFVRPGHLHVPKKVLRATSEQGLVVAPAEPDAANKGTLRVRASGTPLDDVDATVQLTTGGNPTGYATMDAGRGSGVGAIWQHATDAADQYRGHIDTPYLLRNEIFVASDNNQGEPSTPRTLPDGFMGHLQQVNGVAGVTWKYYRVSTAETPLVTSAAIGGAFSPLPATAGTRSDVVVLGSGRMVAGLLVDRANQKIETQFSDDNGITWSAYGTTLLGATGGAARDVLCMESIGDLVVAVLASLTGAISANMLVSRDFGATFTSVDTATTLTNPRTCVANGQLLIAHRAASSVKVYQVAPGGGLPSTVINTTAAAFGAVAIATRDDGTVWAWGWEASASGTLDMDISVSLDGGLSWVDPQTTMVRVIDIEKAAHGGPLYVTLSAGAWEGAIVMLARTSGAGIDSSRNVHVLTWGEWANVTERRDGSYYSHTYLPVDLPDAVGWALVTTGAGAAVSIAGGSLSIITSAGNNDSYTSAAAFWTTVATDTRSGRFRVRVNSGGSRGTGDARILFVTDDGVNSQEVIFGFDATGMRARDGTATVGSDAVIDMTKWVDVAFTLQHDAPAGQGKLDSWYRVEGTVLWTRWHSAAVVVETAGVIPNNVRMGGITAAGVVDWEIMLLEVSDEPDEGFLNGFVNPASLESRPLAAAFDYFVVDGVHIGGVNGGAVPGDLYGLASTYSYGTDSLWSELRPSRSLRSKVDGTVWEVVFDAGALDLFKADIGALFGTNFQDCQFQMNATDAWGGPSVDVALSSTVFTGTADSSGPGFAKVVGFPQFRPHEFRSDGDAHRWFVVFDTIGGNVHYEITDNDTDRVYIDGVDLTTIIKPGKFEIYGNRMASPLGGFQQYRFARISVAAIDTADKYFEVGTPIFDVLFQPTVSYDWGFVDRLEANTELLVTDGGYRSSSRQGPRRSSVAVQWPVIDRIGKAKDLDQQITDFYGAIEGSHTPIVYWRDDTDNGETLQLVRVLEVLSISNTLGEGANQAGRVDQLRLSEEW